MNRFLWKVTIHKWQTIIDGQFCIAILSYRRVQLWFALESGTLPTPGSAASENSHEFLAVAFSKVARHQLSHSILMGSKQKHVLGTLDLLPVNRKECVDVVVQSSSRASHSQSETKQIWAYLKMWECLSSFPPNCRCRVPHNFGAKQVAARRCM
jgi:hypothetical protein